MKILLVSNCNTEGLKNSLLFHAPQLNLDAVDINQFKKDNTPETSTLNKYDTIIGITDTFLHIKKIGSSHNADEITLPPFTFSAFHPDICYVMSNGKIIQSKMHDYHSIIMLAAFLSDIPKEKIHSLFNKEVYDKLGYFSLWDSSMEYLKNSYSFLNIDIDEWIQKRSGYYGSFMHTMNHPKIYMLSDLAQSLLDYLEIKHHKSSEPPIPDNLVIGPSWPIYSEIALQYGFTGHYRFRPFADYRSFGLKSYIEDSINHYKTMGKESITVLQDQNQGRVKNAIKIIGEIL